MRFTHLISYFLKNKPPIKEACDIQLCSATDFNQSNIEPIQDVQIDFQGDRDGEQSNRSMPVHRTSSLQSLYEKTTLPPDYLNQLKTAKDLKSELAKLKQANVELVTKLDQLEFERQAIKVQIETQVVKNSQTAEENSEFFIHVTENQYLVTTVDKLKERLETLTAKVDDSRSERRQLRNECINIELERERILDEYQRLEVCRQSKNKKLQSLQRLQAELEVQREYMLYRRGLTDRWQEMLSTLRVFVKVHSVTKQIHFNGNWPQASGCLVMPTFETIGITVSKPTNRHTLNQTVDSQKLYHFNQIFMPNVSQANVYRASLLGHITRILDGFNVTVLFHGASGSGKTHTCCGLVSLAVEDLLQAIEERGASQLTLYVSILEFYNEHVTCLLSGKSVRVKDTGSMVTVEEQSEELVCQLEDFNNLLSRACTDRKSRVLTPQGHASSRSHMVVLVKAVSTSGDQDNALGTVVFCDLAGSHRFTPSNSIAKDRVFRQESWNIQKSLILLTGVLHQLKQDGALMKSCRGSRLTEFLKPSFCGDAYMTLILTVTDDPESWHTTQNTLELGRVAMETVLQQPIQHSDSVVQGGLSPE